MDSNIRVISLLKGLNDACVKELLDFARALLPLPPGAGNIALILPNSSKALNPQAIFIRESVDSLCRDGADAQYMQYILKQKLYNFTTNTLKAYLSVQASSLSAFVISKTHTRGQKPSGRQLNAKVCGHESAIFRILSFFLRPRC